MIRIRQPNLVLMDEHELDDQLNSLTNTLQRLNIQERRIRRESSEIRQQIQRIQQQRARRASAFLQVVRRDRQGDTLDIGDYVNFLTRGRFSTRGGTITGISNRRFVTAQDSTGRLINREPANVEIVRKYNETHDRRDRL